MLAPNCASKETRCWRSKRIIGGLQRSDLLAEPFLNDLPAVAGFRIGLQVVQSLVENFTVPIGNRESSRSRCDAVPQRLQIVDLLVDRQLVETGRRQRDWRLLPTSFPGFRTPSACFSGDFYPASREIKQERRSTDHILANPLMGHKVERRPGSGEIWFAVTEHDGVQVDSILIDRAKFGEAVRQARASHFDLPVAFGLQLADRGPKIILNKPGVGADRLQRARDDPFRLVPPRRRKACSSASHSG